MYPSLSRHKYTAYDYVRNGLLAQLLIFNQRICRDAKAQPLGHTGWLLRLAAWFCVHVPIEVSHSCQGADQTFATQTQYCRTLLGMSEPIFPLDLPLFTIFCGGGSAYASGTLDLCSS
jgi:hypothetical protein